MAQNVLVGPKENILIPQAHVTAIIQTYNAAEGLKLTLESLKDHVDRVLVLDGFFEMPGGHKHPGRSVSGESTDNSRQIVKGYGGEWVRPDRNYADQIDKLNRIPELVPENEWAFIIDTDEVLVSYIRDGLRILVGWFSKWPCDFLPLRIEEPYYAHPFTGVHGRNRFYARLIRVKKGMRWTNEGIVIYPEGRVSLYMGTFPSTVWIRHLRRDH